MDTTFPKNSQYTINPWSLSFPKSFEQSFYEDYFQKSLRQVRLALLLGIFFYAIFGILDSFMVPEVRIRLWFIRYSIVIPYILGVYLFTYTSYFKKYMQVSLASSILTAGIGIIAMIVVAPYPANYSYYAGLILIFIYGYSFLKLRFIWASIACWTIVVSYEIAAALLVQTPISILINNNFFFLAGNIIGMFVCYSIEYYSRRDYIKARLLEEEKQKVDLANLKLESRVEERTAQLSKAISNLRQEISVREGAEEALKSRIIQEQLITRLSTMFIHLPPQKIDEGINTTLQTIGEFAHVDHSFIYQFFNKEQKVILTHAWRTELPDEKIDYPEQYPDDDKFWMIRTIKAQETVIIGSVSDLPEEAVADQKIMQSTGIKSLILIPMVFQGSTNGMIGFDAVQNEKPWTEDIIALLKIVGDMLMTAIERKKAHNLLRQSENKYRNFFESSKDVLFFSSPDGQLLDINPAGAELFGYDSKEELLRVNISRDLYVNPEDRKTYMRLVERDGHIRDFELTLKRKDSKIITVQETTTTVRNEADEILFYQGILRDITERRHLEQQLRQSQKMESIGLLAGGIAHDFNNILTVINGYAELVLKNMKSSDPNYRDIKKVLNGGLQAANLTRQLLAFSRKQVMLPKIIKINKVITDLEKMLHRLIGEDIKMEVILEKEIDSIQADPGQIEQILINLIINARDAINIKTEKAQNKKIIIETRELYLDQNYVALHPTTVPGRYNQISISDTGIGMDDATMNKIFEPFFTTKETGKGTGLGLSTVYGIVKQNNGNIYVYSEPGKGTTFHIYWPCAGQQEILIGKEDQDTVARGTETILLVEDEKQVRDFAFTALKSMGYKVFTACNGVEAIKLIENIKIQIHLLITDIIMPEMGGKILADKIQKIIPQIKILFNSGYTDNHIVLSGELDEKKYFLQKPYSITEIAKKVRYVLDN